MASNLFGIDSYSEIKAGVVLVNDASRLALAFNLNQAHLHPSRSSLAACSKLKSGFYLGTAYSIYYPSSLSSKFAFNYQIGIAQKIGNQWRYSAHFSRYHHNSNEYANSSQFTFLINYDWSEQLRLSWDLLLGEEAIAAFGILIEQDSKEYQLIILSTKALQISYAKEYNDFKILFALQSHLALGLSPLFNLDYEI